MTPRRPLTTLSAVLLVVTALVHAACSGRTSTLDPRLRGAAEGFNVVLITLDTTRADRLGCYGGDTVETPSLDGLAEHGALFTNAVTVAPVTAPSHASILTGLYPPSHGVRANGQYRLGAEHVTIAETLQRRGYRTGAFVSSFVLNHRYGLDQGFDTYDEAVQPKTQLGPQTIMERPAGVVTDATIDWLSRSTEQPFFVWIHYFDPHRPYSPPPQFARQYPGRPYEGEIAYVDSQIGRLIEALDDSGLRERTLIVVVADHGESLGEHEEPTHGFFVYEPVMRVPFILSAPELFSGKQVVEDTVVSVVDLFPTLIELLGLPDAPATDGDSLLRVGRSQDRSVYMESMDPYLDYGWSPLFALRGKDDKYIEAPDPEYYLLPSDPGENENLIDTRSEAVGRRAATLERMLGEWPPFERVAEERIPPDEETAAKLRSLGYVGGSSAHRGATLADPKRKIDQYERFLRAQTLASMGRGPEALAILEDLVESMPNSVVLLDYLARANVFMGRLGQAESYVRRLLAIHADADSLMLLAQVLIAQDRLDEVDALVERALALDPSHGRSIVVQGDLAAKAGEYDRALERYRHAERVDPYRVGPLVESRIAWVTRLRSDDSPTR
jgi:arylsulfatase A-like enzyme